MGGDASDRRASHPVANAIGAVLIGAREGDARVRRRAKGWIGLMTGGGFAVWVAARLVTFGEEVLRHEWQASAEGDAVMVASIQAMRGDLYKLTTVIEQDRAERAMERQQDREDAERRWQEERKEARRRASGSTRVTEPCSGTACAQAPAAPAIVIESDTKTARAAHEGP